MGETRALIGKCGFYCGSCPDYINNSCSGCRAAHTQGDCFTFDCVDKQGVEFCGECSQFPCQELFTREKHTVLNIKWLEWKLSQRNERK